MLNVRMMLVESGSVLLM